MDKIEKIKKGIKELEDFFAGGRSIEPSKLICNFSSLLTFIDHLIAQVFLIIDIEEGERQKMFWQLKKLRVFLLNKVKPSIEGKVIK